MNRAQELLLELLLIRARYGDAEITSVEEELKNLPRSEDLKRLLACLSHLDEKKKLRTPPRAEITPEVLGKMKRKFLQLLDRDQRYADIEKLREVARRLGLKEFASERPAALREISDKLDSMSDDEATKLLRRFKIDREPDQGYLGLADYLIHSRG